LNSRFPAMLPLLAFLLLPAAARADSPTEETAPPALDLQDEEAPTPTLDKERLSDVGFWESAAGAAPDDVTVRLALGNAYAMNRRFPEAIREYKRVLRTYPESKAAWNNTGSAYRAMAKPDEALDAYRKALKLDPRYGLAYYNMGAVYDSRGYYDRAVKNYGLALRYDPKLMDSKRNPQVVNNKRLYAVFLQNYVESAGSLALPLEPAYPENPEE